MPKFVNSAIRINPAKAKVNATMLMVQGVFSVLICCNLSRKKTSTLDTTARRVLARAPRFIQNDVEKEKDLGNGRELRVNSCFSEKGFGTECFRAVKRAVGNVSNRQKSEPFAAAPTSSHDRA